MVRMAIVDNFRNNIKRLIDEEKTSIAKIHTETGLSRNSIYGWIDRNEVPGLDKVELIAAHLGLSLSSLLGDDVPELPKNIQTADQDRLAAIAAILSAEDSSISVLLDLIQKRNLVGGSKRKKSSDLG